TLGTACTAEHVQKLFRFTESVIFSFDGDSAGRRAATRALEASLAHATDTRTIRFLFLPSEHDPDSYVRELGPEAFERCVAAAVPRRRAWRAARRGGQTLAARRPTAIRAGVRTRGVRFHRWRARSTALSGCSAIAPTCGSRSAPRRTTS